MQSRGNSYTVATDRGYMYRIEESDADALGISAALTQPATALEGRINEGMVWNRLRTVYDPEIPVNIVNLGLTYSCEITQLEERARKIDIKMPMTAPGCGMGNVLKADVESKLSRLPSVKAVSIDAVFDPPWNLSRMSEALGCNSEFDQKSPRRRGSRPTKLPRVLVWVERTPHSALRPLS